MAYISDQKKTQPVPDRVLTQINYFFLLPSLEMKIASVGDLIRKLKAEKASKDAIGVEVKVLLSLKELFKKKTGQDWKPPSQAKPDTKQIKEPSPVKTTTGDDQV